MNKLNTLIIGAGNIGAFFDGPKDKNILTHAHAYKKHSEFELLGFVDNDPLKAIQAAKIWGCKSYKNIEAAFNEEKRIDVVSVCVPDDFHYEVIKNLADKPIKLVFAEKPITKNVIEAKEILDIYAKNYISLSINYSRRFAPEFNKLRKEIEKGKYGRFIGGTGYYGKGIIHNGSHMIDLIRMLIGEITEAKPFSKEFDFYQDDPSVSTILNMQNGANMSLLAVNCRNFTIFELDLIFEKGRVHIIDSGNSINKYKISNSEVFSGYKYLLSDEAIKNVLNKSIYFAVEDIFNHLSKKGKLVCDGKEATLALETVVKIKEKALHEKDYCHIGF